MLWIVGGVTNYSKFGHSGFGIEELKKRFEMIKALF